MPICQFCVHKLIFDLACLVWTHQNLSRIGTNHDSHRATRSTPWLMCDLQVFYASSVCNGWFLLGQPASLIWNTSRFSGLRKDDDSIELLYPPHVWYLSYVRGFCASSLKVGCMLVWSFVWNVWSVIWIWNQWRQPLSYSIYRDCRRWRCSQN